MIAEFIHHLYFVQISSCTSHFWSKVTTESQNIHDFVVFIICSTTITTSDRCSLREVCWQLYVLAEGRVKSLIPFKSKK